jgi:signal peptidase I
MFIVNAPLSALNMAYPGVAVGLIVVLVQLLVVFMILRRVFGLSSGRTLAPFGAYVAWVGAALVLATGVIRPFLVEGFRMPSQNMAPTIAPGDRVLVNKVTQPRRWDVIVHWSNGPHSPVYCKRLVALPGERLRFDQGTIFINDKAADVPPVLAGRCHAAIADENFAPMARYRDGQTIQRGPNECFLMGDNVELSYDSRMTGPLPRSALIGVVDLMYWPLNKIHIFR